MFNSCLMIFFSVKFKLEYSEVAPVASIKGTVIWSNAGVPSKVVFKITTGGKVLLTDMTFERLFSCVNPVMNL